MEDCILQTDRQTNDMICTTASIILAAATRAVIDYFDGPAVDGLHIQEFEAREIAQKIVSYLENCFYPMSL